MLHLSVTAREFAAWESIRHPRAHGDFSINANDRGGMQLEADRQFCVGNVINKFVLALFGYSGPFVDYSTRGFPRRNFPS